MHQRVAGAMASLTLLSVLAFAQHPGHSGVEHRVTIDGSQTPELVTDAEAYNVWFIALAEPNDGTLVATRKLAAKLSPVALTEPDLSAVRGALATFKVGFDKIVAARLQLSSAPSTAESAQMSQQLRAAEDQLVLTTRQTMQTRTSPDGWSALNTYVTGHVKSRIKIYIVQH